MIISGFGWLCLVPGRIKSSFHWAAHWGESRGHSLSLSPAVSFPIVHGDWMYPKEKKCGKPSDLQNNIDLCSVSEKHMQSPSFACAGARCIPSLGIQRQITACAAQNRVHGLSLCHHELLGRSLQNSKADQRHFSLCLLCFLSPSSFSGCWCKLGVSLLKEVKL